LVVVDPAKDLHDADPGPVVAEAMRAIREEREHRAGVRERVFGSREFFKLWLAQFVSALGDWLGLLAITITATRVGGGSGGAAVGLVMTARIAPGFFLGPLAGVVVDRFDRKKVMVICDLSRAGVLLFLPFVDTVAGLVFASLLLEVFTLLWSPAKEASVPNLVPPERLASSNSLSLAAAYGTMPVASVLFALLATLAKALGHIDALDALQINQEALAFYADVLTFCTSAFLISRVSLGAPSKADAEDDGSRPTLKQTFAELREGWSLIFINPVVRAVIVGLATGLIGGGMVVPLGAIFSDEVLGAGASGYGVFVTALGFGAAIGVVGVNFAQRKLSKELLFTVGIIGAGAAMVAAACFSNLVYAALCVGIFGIGAGTAYVVGYTLLHEHVDDEYRGRIFSALYTVVRLCLLIALAVGPFLSSALDSLSNRLFDDRLLAMPGGGHIFLPGVRLTLWLGGLVILVAAVLVVLSLRTEHRRHRTNELSAEPS
jgi:dTMP kinase